MAGLLDGYGLALGGLLNSYGGLFGNVGAAMPEAYGANAPIMDPLAKAVMSTASLPQRAMESSANMVRTGQYDPAPILEAAMLPMGTGAIAGVPMRSGEAVLGAGPVRAQYGVGDPTKTGWVFKDVAHPPMQRGDWRRVTAATDTGEGIQNVELPIRSMYATQKAVNSDFAKPLSNNTELPFVLKKDGRYFVQDGHHRLTAASEAGKETARVRLVDLDGTMQTDFPLVDLMMNLQRGY